MPLPGERFYTIDAFYAMPEGERAELINGQPYRTAAQYYKGCLLYTSDAADDLLCVDLGGSRIIKKKKKEKRKLLSAPY